MAIRVDDIVVTEKNVLLLSGGHQFVADIEKNTDVLDSGNYTRDRNPWNFYSSDGHIYHNLFDTENFDIRTQTLTGSTRHSPNNSRSHESIFMPHDVTYVGNCQFYDNSYTITNFTSSTLSADVTFSDESGIFSCDHGFVRYENPSKYDSPSDDYISPSILFEPSKGVQYITEYPVNGYYMDFGDNETSGNATVFGDSVLCKYYLDNNYSVSSYNMTETSTRFRYLRTYYDIGTTGNSIYMVFRNNLYGDAPLYPNGQNGTVVENSDTYCVGVFPLSSIAYMSNIVTAIGSTSNVQTDDGIFYSSDPYSDMFSYDAMSGIYEDCISVRQPLDKSFILYVRSKNDNETIFTYIPKIGLERSRYEKIIDEGCDGIDIVELDHCVVVGTGHNGILTIWSRDYLYDGGDTLVNFNPFQKACSGIPSSESLTSEIDGDLYRDIHLFYNGSDILGAKATMNNELSAYGSRVAFFSTSFKDEVRNYEIGQFFVPAGNPLYEMETVSSEIETKGQTLSSVPVSSIDLNGRTVWNFEMKQVDVVTGTTTVTSMAFQTSANYVYDSDILFDYSSTEVDGEIAVGSYAFLQFEKYGLAKCHVDDIYGKDGMAHFSSTGPVNRYDSRKRIWTKTGSPCGNDWRVKGKSNTFDDLKRNLPFVPSVGDICSVVDAHEEGGWTAEPYSYFAYAVDGNTSSWKLTTVDYIDGHVETVDELFDVDASDGNVYFLSNSSQSLSFSFYSDNSGEGFSENPEYGFFMYSIKGNNLSSWEYVGDSLIYGRISDISNLPGISSYYEETPQEQPSDGDIMLVTDESTINGFGHVPQNQFYIYDLYALRINGLNPDTTCITYVRGWTPFNASECLSSAQAGPARFVGAVTVEQMASEGYQVGDIVILSEDGQWSGNTFTRGSFYKRTTISDGAIDINGNKWVYENENIIFNNTTLTSSEYYGYKIHEYAKFRGCFTSYDELAKSPVPPKGSIYFVNNAYENSDLKYPAYTFFRYGYDGNLLGWKRYDYISTLQFDVSRYEDLLRYRDVDRGNVALVRGKTYSKTEPIPDCFYEYGIDGNVSTWKRMESVGRVNHWVVNYSSLPDVDIVPKDGDICLCKAETNELETLSSYDANSFYMFTEYGNSSKWSHIELSSLGIPFSGYADSYEYLDNLSGDVGSIYFTESYDEPLTFYSLVYNDDEKVCTDVAFSVMSYGDGSKDSIFEAIDYVISDYSAKHVSGKSALRSIFRSKEVDGNVRYTNSFSAFPLNERDVVMEPIFSTTHSLPIETTPMSTFSYALGKPIENSMGVSVMTFKNPCTNHDAPISIVKWNLSSGELTSHETYYMSGGLHLQYYGICTDVYVNGTTLSSINGSTDEPYTFYSSTIYEYPHPCYGELKTAGTNLPIFEGTLSDEMNTDDFFFVNGYFVVKNYSVSVSNGKSDDEWEKIDKCIIGSGKHPTHQTGDYPSGGYVVTNFFASDEYCGISKLYESKLVESSKENPKTSSDSERFYDYNYLWHILPTKPIEFYPESVEGKPWMPYYPSTYVDFIKYHNGYYYISLRSDKIHNENTVGYDIIETDSLFKEKKLVKLEGNLIVTGIKFFDSHIAVEYEDLSNGRFIKWFESGKSHYKVSPTIYSKSSGQSVESVKKSEIEIFSDNSSNVLGTYDNVEVINSLNRFTPVVNHKSNMFSIRIEDLGLEESEYLTDYQKKVLRTYFRNSITELVNSVKPAHTQIFDVYLS